jgi:hypothetical protein
MGIQEVNWEGGVTEPAGEFAFFLERVNRIMN